MSPRRGCHPRPTRSARSLFRWPLFPFPFFPSPPLSPFPVSRIYCSACSAKRGRRAAGYFYTSKYREQSHGQTIQNSGGNAHGTWGKVRAAACVVPVEFPPLLYGAGRDRRSSRIEHDPCCTCRPEASSTPRFSELRPFGRHYFSSNPPPQSFINNILSRHPPESRSRAISSVIRSIHCYPHLDFLRVSDDQLVRINVPIHFINEDQSKAGRKAGVVISHQTWKSKSTPLPRICRNTWKLILSTWTGR